MAVSGDVYVANVLGSGVECLKPIKHLSWVGLHGDVVNGLQVRVRKPEGKCGHKSSRQGPRIRIKMSECH